MATATQPDTIESQKEKIQQAINVPPRDAEVSEPSKLNEVTKESETKQKEHDDAAEKEAEAKKVAEEGDEAKATAVLADSENKDKNEDKKNDAKKDDKKPAGGYDATPIPRAQAGYTIKITIHRAQNLPMADINSLSSDPFVVSQIYTTNLTRHREDPPLRMRTFTVRRNINPQWNAEWIVANIPASGFKMKCRIYDEDPADHDDRLGNAHVHVPSLDENWPGIQEQSFKVKKRMGSKRAYLFQALATGVRMRQHMDGHLVLSIEMLGQTESEHGGRVYTVGPMWWTRHYSPLLGRFLGRKTPGASKEAEEEEAEGKPKAERYNFQANQFQLHGPVPAELYHRYVEFKPFVKGMFTSSGIRGFFLHKALMHQHAQIYHFDRSTESAYIEDGPSPETTKKFLELVHFDTGGRIFTYIITLDSLFRFTETGKEFGIDLLSKHTMHSEVSAYIAFSGEFFIRRLKYANRDPPEVGGNNKSHPPDNIDNGSPSDNPPKDPEHYELIIDNDSGTYRPKAELLPKLKEFLHYNFPGLQIVTLDCNADAELQQKMKSEQRQKKEEEGDHIIYRQAGRGSSISSSDISDLDDMADGQNGAEPSFVKTIKHDISRKGKSRGQHWKGIAKGRDVHEKAESSGQNGAKHPTKTATEPALNGAGSKDIAVENGDGPKKAATTAT